VVAAYEFAVDRVGAAFHAGPLWAAYVRLLAGASGGDSLYGDSQRRDALRKVYHRAVAGVEVFLIYNVSIKIARRGGGGIRWSVSV
jgi:hypothetical protein